MTFEEWITAGTGRVTRVAAHFAITKSAVSQWGARGVPLERMAAVCDLTGGAVSIEEMVRSRAQRKVAA